MVIELFNVFLVRLDPTTGAETAKTRPVVVENIRQLIAKGDYPEKLWA